MNPASHAPHWILKRDHRWDRDFQVAGWRLNHSSAGERVWKNADTYLGKDGGTSLVRKKKKKGPLWKSSSKFDGGIYTKHWQGILQ